MKRVLKFFIILAIALATYFLPFEIGFEARLTLSILVLSILLWLTETIPLFLTSLFASMLIVFLNIFSFNEALPKFVDPVIILLFAGFMIARCMEKLEIDKRIAGALTSRIKNSRLIILGLMSITAFLSMWISNTAAAIILISIALAIILKAGKEVANFSKAMILGIAFSANIGGIGTIIGTPPNAIAVSKLSELANIEITFFGWMAKALPLMVVLVFVIWAVLIIRFPFKKEEFRLKQAKIKPFGKEEKLFFAIFAATVALWLTTEFTHLPNALIGLIGVTALLLTGLLKGEDFGKIDWTILILLGGGLLLGSAMSKSGLAAFFAESISVFLIGKSATIIIAATIMLSIAMTAFASNTATAAILIPIVIPLSQKTGFSIETMALIGGIAVSLDFLVPVGTPPNAIAYATHKVSLKEMVTTGLILSVITVVLFTLLARFIWPLI